MSLHRIFFVFLSCILLCTTIQYNYSMQAFPLHSNSHPGSFSLFRQVPLYPDLVVHYPPRNNSGHPFLRHFNHLSDSFFSLPLSKFPLNSPFVIVSSMSDFQYHYKSVIYEFTSSPFQCDVVYDNVLILIPLHCNSLYHIAENLNKIVDYSNSSMSIVI